jgi:hypothetical protein
LARQRFASELPSQIELASRLFSTQLEAAGGVATIGDLDLENVLLPPYLPASDRDAQQGGGNNREDGCTERDHIGNGEPRLRGLRDWGRRG